MTDHVLNHAPDLEADSRYGRLLKDGRKINVCPVSYTHLTLPTIYSV